MWMGHLEKCSLTCLKLVCKPSASSLILTLLVKFWFIVFSLLFFYLKCDVLFDLKVILCISITDLIYCAITLNPLFKTAINPVRLFVRTIIL